MKDSRSWTIIPEMFRFADVPLSLSGMTRIAGKRVYLRAPTMDDWAEWAELRARSRAFLTPWEPTWPEDSLGRDHYRRRLRQPVPLLRHRQRLGLVFLGDGLGANAGHLGDVVDRVPHQGLVVAQLGGVGA